MARRGDRKSARKVVTNPGSATPWYYDETTFAPKSKTADPRADSEFFSEFSTESLFSGGPATTGPTDPYEVLGLFPGASLDQVKRAHRKLAKRYHPDRFMNAPDSERIQAELKMVQINGAYSELRSRVTPLAD